MRSQSQLARGQLRLDRLRSVASSSFRFSYSSTENEGVSVLVIPRLLVRKSGRYEPSR